MWAKGYRAMINLRSRLMSMAPELLAKSRTPKGRRPSAEQTPSFNALPAQAWHGAGWHIPLENRRKPQPDKRAPDNYAGIEDVHSADVTRRDKRPH